MKRRKNHLNRGYALYLLPGVLLCIPVILVPVIANFGLSFTRWQGVGTPTWVGLHNYRRLLQDSNFWASFRHIGVVVVAMAVIPTLLGLFLAAAALRLHRQEVRRPAREPLPLGPLPAPGAAGRRHRHRVGVAAGAEGAVNTFFKDIGLQGLKTDWLGNPSWALLSVGLVLIWVQIGYPVVMFMAGLQRIDPQLYEAADIDGASWWQRFRHITVHLIQPGVLRGAGHHHHRGAQGVRPDLRADQAAVRATRRWCRRTSRTRTSSTPSTSATARPLRAS